MNYERSTVAIRHLRSLYSAGTAGGLSDRQLLERFKTGHHDAAELAFTALVQRHGPMVLRVCRGVLGDPHEAQDAFQATFLVLARKAGSLSIGESLAPWLHAVALRVANRARTRIARRRRVEQCAAAWAAREVDFEPAPDLVPVLHEEVGRLREKYRAPIVLCYLQGQTHEGAAAQLGWPVGTVRGRLARARGLLKQRLTRRGLGLPAGLLAAGSLPESASATVSAALADATARAAVRIAAGEAVVDVVSATVTVLVEGIRRAMIVNRLKVVGTLLVTLGIAGLGGMRFGHAFADGAEGTERKATAPAAAVAERDRARTILRQSAEAAASIERPLDRGYTFADLGIYMAKAGDSETSEQWFRKATETAASQRQEHGLWHDLVWARRAAGDLDGAWRGTDAPYDLESKLRDLRKLARAQVRASRPADAFKSLDRAAQLVRAQPQYAHQSQDLFNIARDRALDGDPKGALQMVDRVTFEGKFARLREAEYSAALFVALEKAGDRTAGETLLRRAIANRDSLAPGATAEFNLASRCIAESLAEAGKLDDAIGMARLIRGDAVGLDMCEVGRKTARIRLERGEADWAARVLEHVLQISSTIRGDGDRAETLLLITRNCLERGDTSGAERAAGTVPDTYPQRAFALTEVALALREAGSHTSATSALQAATRAAEAVATEAERSEALRRVAEVWALSGEITEALRLVEAIVDPYAKAEALRHAAIAQVAKRQCEAARSLLARANELAQDIRVNTKRAEILCGLAAAWGQSGDRETAAQAFCQAVAAVSALPDPGKRCEALSAIARAQLGTGDRDAARSTVRQAIEAALATNDAKPKNTFLRHSADRLSTLATIQAENGDEDGALTWAGTLTSPIDRSWALRGVALGLLKRIGAWTAEDQERLYGKDS